jgi:hypothetical protein
LCQPVTSNAEHEPLELPGLICVGTIHRIIPGFDGDRGPGCCSVSRSWRGTGGLASANRSRRSCLGTGRLDSANRSRRSWLGTGRPASASSSKRRRGLFGLADSPGLSSSSSSGVWLDTSRTNLLRPRIMELVGGWGSTTRRHPHGTGLALCLCTPLIVTCLFMHLRLRKVSHGTRLDPCLSNPILRMVHHVTRLEPCLSTPLLLIRVPNGTRREPCLFTPLLLIRVPHGTRRGTCITRRRMVWLQQHEVPHVQRRCTGATRIRSSVKAVTSLPSILARVPSTKSVHVHRDDIDPDKDYWRGTRRTGHVA